MIVHFVYVKGDHISTPYAITNELASRLAKKYDLKVYDWNEKTTIKPGKGDILIGHPHPERNTIYRNSFRNKGWSKRILMNPFAHAMPEYIAFFDDLVTESEGYLAICGKYWIDTIAESIVSHWQPWIEHLDLAVNKINFPFIKNKFNEPGRRSFLYIGHTLPFKGGDYLSSLADANPEIQIGWIGSGEMPSSRITAHGKRNFSDPSSLELISSYDFLIHCGRSDANPTTILEAAAWGLVPVCTPQSGYYEEDWFINIPLDDIDKSSAILNNLNYIPESNLLDYQEKARIALNNHYNWERFSQQVIDCIESNQTFNYLEYLQQNKSKVDENRRILKKIENKRQIGILSQNLKNTLVVSGKKILGVS